MVVDSDLAFSFVPVFLMILISLFGLVIFIVLMAEGAFRPATKTLAVLGALWSVFIGGVIATSWLSPQTIVKIGESYCEDIWCIGVKNVTVELRNAETQYNLDVRIFSDANTAEISAKGASLFLVDDEGRHYPLVASSPIPFDTNLKPRQVIDTSLMFVVPSNARHLFLTGMRGGSSGGGEIPPFARILVSLYVFSDTSLMHKQPLLRVL
jgi:hypothetical protein